MSGLKNEIKRRNYDRFSEKEKRTIIEDYLQSGLVFSSILIIFALEK